MWTPQAFAGVEDYGSWQSELLEDEDPERHIPSPENPAAHRTSARTFDW